MGRPRKHQTEEERKAARSARNARYFAKPDKKAAQRERCRRRAEKLRELRKTRQETISKPRQRELSVCSDLTEELLGALEEGQTIEEPGQPSAFSPSTTESIKETITSYDHALQKFRNHQSDIDFAKRRMDVSLHETTTGQKERRAQDLNQLEHEAAEQARRVQRFLNIVSDLDPGYKNPLTIKIAVQLSAFTRIRRTLRQERLLVATGVYKQWMDEQKLLWQRDWGKDVDLQAAQLQEVSFGL